MTMYFPDAHGRGVVEEVWPSRWPGPHVYFLIFYCNGNPCFLISDGLSWKTAKRN